MIDNDAEMCLIGMPLMTSIPLAVAYLGGELSELLHDPHVMFLYGCLIGVWLSFTVRSWDEIALRFRRGKEAWKNATLNRILESDE